MKKYILVTGSTRGLGYEIAQDLLKSGFNVIFNGRNGKKLKKIYNKFNKTYNVLYFKCDFLKKNVSSKLVQFLKANDVFINGIVHNVGGKLENDMHPIDNKILKKTMRFNIENAIDINNLIIPYMVDNGGGKIIHIGSTAGDDGNASPSYAISKGALNIYVKNSARYYAKDNIMICAVSPGILNHQGSGWDLKKKNDPKKYFSRKKLQPLKKFAKPNEIAPYVAILFKINSMQATGSIIKLNGGV